MAQKSAEKLKLAAACALPVGCIMNSFSSKLHVNENTKLILLLFGLFSRFRIFTLLLRRLVIIILHMKGFVIESILQLYVTRVVMGV